MQDDRSYEIDIYDNRSIYSEYQPYDQNKKYFVNENSNVRKNKGKTKEGAWSGCSHAA